MIKIYDEIRWKVAQEILAAIAGGGFSIPDENVADKRSLPTRAEIAEALVEPPSAALGNLAFGCFSLAKILRKSPAEVAKLLVVPLTENLTKASLEPQKKTSQELQTVLKSAQAVGPYLNLVVSTQALSQLLIQPITEPPPDASVDPKLNVGPFFRGALYRETPRTMVEFSQPNTHKELHVGHMRNLSLGDALIRMHRFAGFEIVSSTFPGDVGTHVAKCLWYLTTHNQEAIPDQNRGEWLGRMYSLANLRLEDEVGTSHEASNREALTAILKQLEEKRGPAFDLWKETRGWSIELMKQIYAWAQVEFDIWYWESDVDSESVRYIKSLYHQKKLIESQGAIGMDLESEGLGFCLLLKSDGTGLYASKDLELARRKFQDFNIEKSIYVVDLRQNLHFKQVFKVLEKLGFEQATKCFHLQYNYVELPDGPMSSRTGNIVPLTRLIEKMEATVKSEFLSRYQGEWSTQEIALVATQVAQGAIKYGMLRIDTNKKIVFDMKEWLKIEGESGPFIQYSVARIQSLCQKFNYRAGSVQLDLLSHASEIELLSSLLHYKTVVCRCVETLTPSPMCTYLYQLAKKFNHFYHECSIGQAETEELKRARLKLAKATGEILKHGLQLLGIPSPERM